MCEIRKSLYENWIPQYENKKLPIDNEKLTYENNKSLVENRNHQSRKRVMRDIHTTHRDS